MWHMGTDIYECDFCGVEIQWDESDALHGSMWECEECGEHFCEKCFTDRWGFGAWDAMLHQGLSGSFADDIIMCPECYEKYIREHPNKEV